MPINKFRGVHFFLSNFFPCRNGVNYDGHEFPTSEHAYQAGKIEERHGRESFTCGGSLGDNPMDAKSKGKKVKMRPSWDRMKVDVMLEAVRSKFARDGDLQQKLLATQNQLIVEGHTGDKFWGGKANHLGNILMRVRGEVREQQQQLQLAAPRVAEELEGASGKQKQRSKGNTEAAEAFQKQLEALERSFEQYEENIVAHASLGSDGPARNQTEPADDQGSLPSSFVAWLRSSLSEELSASDAESLFCSAEVVLGGAMDEPTEALEMTLELLSEEGALVTAGQLEAQWAAHIAR